MPVSLDDIPNKKAFEQDLAAQMGGAQTVSVVFVDLDGFKQVNDQHGHPEGDRCLMDSAAAMSAVIDGRGRLYRPGGDEFCIILPNRSGSDATADAELVRLSIARLKPFGGISKVTASIGVATSCAKLTDARALIAAADEAMYVKVDLQELRDHMAAVGQRTHPRRSCEAEFPRRFTTGANRSARQKGRG